MIQKRRKLGVCIVGCGYMGTIHAARWVNVPGVEIIAVVDIDDTRAEKLATEYKLDRYFTDYLDAIALPDVDVISVCVPTSLHVNISVAAAKLGKHILCEKPIALTLEQADQIINVARGNHVKLGVGFMRRHSPVVQELKTFLSAGSLGRPVMYIASDVREIRPKFEMHDANINGGPVIDMGVHLVDLWKTIFDSKPITVAAQGLKIGAERLEIAHIEDIAVDTATIAVKFESGDVGTFVVTWGLPPKVSPPSRNDQAYGPKGLVEAYFAGNKQEFRVMQEGGTWKTVSISHQDMYQNQADSFARWILDDEPFPAIGEDGRDALAVALAALESIQSNQTIQL